MEIHTINPVYDVNSRILILGSFPSVKSREARFFYGHPQNRFWKLLGELFNENAGDCAKEKTAFLKKHNIALWDVIASCEIEGSSDSSITNVTPNDISIILEEADIRAIFTNGKTADKLYKKYIEKKTGRKAICLPSTSPANAAWTFDKLKEEWKQIL